jgi:hypothetical protein
LDGSNNRFGVGNKIIATVNENPLLNTFETSEIIETVNFTSGKIAVKGIFDYPRFNFKTMQGWLLGKPVKRDYRYQKQNNAFYRFHAAKQIQLSGIYITLSGDFTNKERYLKKKS